MAGSSILTSWNAVPCWFHSPVCSCLGQTSHLSGPAAPGSRKGVCLQQHPQGKPTGSPEPAFMTHLHTRRCGQWPEVRKAGDIIRTRSTGTEGEGGSPGEWVLTLAGCIALVAEFAKRPELSLGEVQSPVWGCRGMAAVPVIPGRISRPLSVSSVPERSPHPGLRDTWHSRMGPHLRDQAALLPWARAGHMSPCLHFQASQATLPWSEHQPCLPQSLLSPPVPGKTPAFLQPGLRACTSGE